MVSVEDCLSLGPWWSDSQLVYVSLACGVGWGLALIGWALFFVRR